MSQVATRIIPFGRPWITEEDRQAVAAVLHQPTLTHGQQGEAFEAAFSALVGDGVQCVAVSSCMAALHLASLVLGIGAGDEVIVPAQTHVATSHAVELVGAKPVFVDCDPRTGNLTPAGIAAAITPRTKAIAVVHFLGIPCAMPQIMELAARHRLRVIEDCALALGARYRGTHVGLFGDVGGFSFYPVKHITTGEGGMVVTRDRALAERMRRVRAFGVDRTPGERTLPGMYDVSFLGLNYRMSELQAALGRTQLGRIDENLQLRRRHFQALQRALQSQPEVSVLDATTPEAASSHYCLSVVLGGRLQGRRDDVISRLKGLGIGTSIYYPHPVPRLRYYREKYGYDPARFPGAERLSDHSLALPVGPHLTDEDVAYLTDALERVLHEVTT